MAENVSLADQSVIRRVHRDWRPVVKTAHALGWEGRQTKTHLVLVSPDGTKSVETQSAVGGVDGGKLRAAVRFLASMTPEVDMRAAVEDVIDAEPKTLKSSEPWMARVSSDGARADFYPSNSVIERKWSDGSTDYKCAVCDRESANPRSISSHASSHTRRGEKEPVDTTPTVVNQSVDGPRTKRVALLAKEIEAAWEAALGVERSPAERARFMAEHIVNARIAKGRERIEDEPQEHEPQDVLARIKRLLLREELSQREEQQEALVEEVAALRAQVEQAEKERDEAVASGRKARETIRALAQLAGEEEA